MDRYKVIEVEKADGSVHYEVKTYLWGWLPSGYVQEFACDFHGDMYRVGRATWKTKSEALKWVADKLGKEVVSRKEIAELRDG